MSTNTSLDDGHTSSPNSTINTAAAAAAREARRARILAKGADRMARILGQASASAAEVIAAPDHQTTISTTDSGLTEIVDCPVSKDTVSTASTDRATAQTDSTSEPNLTLDEISHDAWGPPSSATTPSLTLGTAKVENLPLPSEPSSSVRPRLGAKATVKSTALVSDPSTFSTLSSSSTAAAPPPRFVSGPDAALDPPAAMRSFTSSAFASPASLMTKIIANSDIWTASHTLLAISFALYSLYQLSTADNGTESHWSAAIQQVRTRPIYTSVDTPIVPGFPMLSLWSCCLTLEVLLLSGKFISGKSQKSSVSGGPNFLSSVLDNPQLGIMRHVILTIIEHRHVWTTLMNDFLLFVFVYTLGVLIAGSVASI